MVSSASRKSRDTQEQILSRGQCTSGIPTLGRQEDRVQDQPGLHKKGPNKQKRVKL